ncbi:MAG TPA: DUF6788 family protein [Terriglobia bacterium]|nr:DUF6788 family protein [Terriglobia bacterium]
MNSPVRRAKLSASERSFRSRMAQLATTRWFLRGTLSERSGRCGKPNCRCAQGELHQSLYLVQSQGGKLRQICVPQAWQARVREAVNDYRKLQELIEAVSELEWYRLRERKR